MALHRPAARALSARWCCRINEFNSRFKIRVGCNFYACAASGQSRRCMQACMWLQLTKALPNVLIISVSCGRWASGCNKLRLGRGLNMRHATSSAATLHVPTRLHFILHLSRSASQHTGTP